MQFQVGLSWIFDFVLVYLSEGGQCTQCMMEQEPGSRLLIASSTSKEENILLWTFKRRIIYFGRLRARDYYREREIWSEIFREEITPSLL